MKRSPIFLFALVLTAAAAAQNPAQQIGYVEDFALAPDLGAQVVQPGVPTP